MHRLRIIPWLAGILVVLTTLAGANHLMQKERAGPSGSSGPSAAAAPPATSNEGLIAKGTVVSDPPPIAFTLPANMSAGTIVEVLVQNGQAVKAGDALIRFDDTMLRHDLKKAMDSYNTAVQDYNAAEQKLKDHPLLVAEAQLALDLSKRDHENLKKQMEVIRKELREVLKVSRDKNEQLLSEEEIRRRIDEDRRILQLQAQIDRADVATRKAENDLKKATQAIDSITIAIGRATFFATSIQNDMNKIEQAIKDCVLRAKVDGFIEQISAAVGQTVYPGTRPPLLYLVPSGTRLVSAEVVPDFAQRLKERIGQDVTITDESHFHLSYTGKLKRIGSAFLPKANSGPDIINGKTNAVLIVEVEVTETNPTDKAPLRVGQPVRVIFR